METIPSGTLIFIYNADSGLGNAFLDSLHKWVSPQTYTCSLCRITHGLAGPKRKWTEFLRDSGRPLRFLHRNELPASRLFAGGGVPPLPAVLEMRDGAPRLLLSAADLDGIPDLDALCRVLTPFAKPGTPR